MKPILDAVLLTPTAIISLGTLLSTMIESSAQAQPWSATPTAQAACTSDELGSTPPCGRSDALAHCLIQLIGPTCEQLVSGRVSESHRSNFMQYYNEASHRADINADGIINQTDINLFDEGVLGHRLDVHRVSDRRSGHSYSLKLSPHQVISDLREHLGDNTCRQHALTSRTVVELNTHFSPWFYANLAGSTQAKGIVFLRGPVDFSNRFHADRRDYVDNPNVSNGEFEFRKLTPVCHSDLGNYDPETGIRKPYSANPSETGDNLGYLVGKSYGFGGTSFTFYPQGIYSPNNDFRRYVQVHGDGAPTYSPIVWRSGKPEPQSIEERTDIGYDHVAIAMQSQYFFFSDVHRRLLTPEFYSTLGLSEEILKNVTKRFFRIDGVVDPGTSGNPQQRANYFFGSTASSSIVLANMWRNNQFQSEHFFDIYDNYYPFSVSWTSFEMLDSLGLVAYWIQATPDRFWGSQSPIPIADQYRYSAWPAINDLFSNWFGFRYGQLNQDPEAENIYRNAVWIRQSNFGGDTQCGTEAGTAGHTRVRAECAPQFNIRTSTQTFDENRAGSAFLPGGVNVVSSMNPTGSTYPAGSFPVLSDEVGFFLAAIFHDIADEFGLGFPAVDRLLVKTISLIDRVDPLPVRAFAHLVRDAARQLWPDPANPGFSIYEDQIRIAFMRRGVAIDARYVCDDSIFPNAPNCCPTTATDPVRCLPSGSNDMAFKLLNHPAPHRLTEPGALASGLRESNPSNGAPQSGTNYFENSSQLVRWRNGTHAPTTSPLVIQTGFGSNTPANHPSYNPTVAGVPECQTNSASYFFDPLNTSSGRCGMTRVQNGFALTTDVNNDSAPAISTPYMAYRFMTGSEFGPCDILRLSNIPVDQEGMLNDPEAMVEADSFLRACPPPENLLPGQWCTELTGNQLNNLTILAPQNFVRWNRDMRSCRSESSDAASTFLTDSSPPGFRVIEAVPQGFSFAVTSSVIAKGKRIYKLSIVDPSQQPDDVYQWTITRYQTLPNQTVIRHVLPPMTGSLVTTGGLPENHPVEIVVTRTRGATSQTLKVVDSVNNLGRRGGQQFVLKVGTCATNSPNCN